MGGEREDVLDQHVVYYLKQHPEFYKKHTISRIRPGVYNLDGREISVDWDYGQYPGDKGFLIAVDGPLRQPFTDYLHGTEDGVAYDNSRLRRSSLEQVPHAQRLSFGESKNCYSRLEAMKIAKEQALVREQAAEYAKDGERVPQSQLMERYKKTIDQKLGKRWRRDQDAKKQAPPPAAAPVAAPEEAPHQPAAAPVASAPPPHPQKQGTPVYCANHDKSEKRPKKRPEQVQCPSCHVTIQTNYQEFALCPDCSFGQHRCMCCGAGAVGKAPSTQGQPLYCCNHDASHKRKKVQPRHMACTSCNTKAETNYAEFTLCHGCSQAEHRCMCCGDYCGDGGAKPSPLVPIPEVAAPVGGSPPPAAAAPWLDLFGSPPPIGSPWQLLQQMQQNQGVQAFNNQMNNLMLPSQMAAPMVPQNPMASQSPMASQNVLASYNVMASQYHMPANPMASQKF